MYQNIAESLAKRFCGTIASQKKCEPFLQPEHTFLFGISFQNPKMNYLLMDHYNLMNLAPATRRQCQKTNSSPFDNLLLIVYEDEIGEISFKLLNGMASVLVKEMVSFCELENAKKCVD